MSTSTAAIAVGVGKDGVGAGGFHLIVFFLLYEYFLRNLVVVDLDFFLICSCAMASRDSEAVDVETMDTESENCVACHCNRSNSIFLEASLSVSFQKCKYLLDFLIAWRFLL